MAVLFSRRPLGLIYMSFVALVASAPDDCNNLTEQTSGWVEGPDGRGTGDILYSCIFTISLCVLTALHLNVPPIGSSFTHRAKRKAGWVIVGIFAPEAVVYAALVQLITVKRFQEKLTKVVEDDLEKAKNVQSTTVQHKKSRLLSPIREDSDPTDQAGPTKPIRRAATNIQLINVDSAAEVRVRSPSTTSAEASCNRPPIGMSFRTERFHCAMRGMLSWEVSSSTYPESTTSTGT